MPDKIEDAVETIGVNPHDKKVHKRVTGEVRILTTDLVSDLEPGDHVPADKISPAVAEALKGKSVIVTRAESEQTEEIAK